jgi:DNA-binding response OmpR family regulator
MVSGAGGSAALHVLLVDDDPSCLAVLAGAFRRHGFLPIGFTSGLAAWAAIHEVPHLPVVVLNWMLPDLDGHLIARRLREREPTAVIAVMVGRGFLPEARERLDIRADYILTKPFPKAGIDHQVRRIAHIARRRLAAASRPAGSTASLLIG